MNTEEKLETLAREVEEKSMSELTNELAFRFESQLQSDEQERRSGRTRDQQELFCSYRHLVRSESDKNADHNKEGLVLKWRQKERLKTTAVALVVCLNIGVDPPDVIKISPCARLECWVDPLSMQAPKALDTIGKNLQAQYERWQPRAKYKMHLDPTTEDVKKLAISCRRTAKNERVLFHYNGHGVPRPTANGEVWVFNKSYTQYIPLSIYDLQTWVGTPAIYVFDCSFAGQILFSFRQFMSQRQRELDSPSLNNMPREKQTGLSQAADPMQDCIILCACSESELLPQNPDLPADVFTSCLTTPIKVALRWFCSRSILRHEGVTKDLIDRIPGKQTDRKTPLGELNWIFTAITDTIAWNVLPRALFQKLFRQDLLVASLFRNFLLAERIMRAANCIPITHPRLPPTHQHPMWQSWDMAAEMCLLQLPGLLEGDSTREYLPSPFFGEQLTAFELWLDHGNAGKKPPEQLPIVLQVLLSQVHRLRALSLLGRFLDMGSWAVDLALSVGIFPYVLKLLQTTAFDLRKPLIFIWTKILAWDASSHVQNDLIKDGGHLYFIKHLGSGMEHIDVKSYTQAAFIISAICNNHLKGQVLCAQAGLFQVCMKLLMSENVAQEVAAEKSSGSADGLHLIVWLLICIGKLSENLPEVITLALQENNLEVLNDFTMNGDPEIRAAAIFALGSLVMIPTATEIDVDTTALSTLNHGEIPVSEGERQTLERDIATIALGFAFDASPLVRAEVAFVLARIAAGHLVQFQDAVHAHQKTSSQILTSTTLLNETVNSLGANTNDSFGLNSAEDSGHSSSHVRDAEYAGSLGSDQVQQSKTSETSAHDGSDHDITTVSPPILNTVQEVYYDRGDKLSDYTDFLSEENNFYQNVVEMLCMLAMDPSPTVASAGKAAMRAGRVEFVMSGARSLNSNSSASSSLTPTLTALPQSGTGMSSFLPKSWQAKSWRSYSQTSSSRPNLITSGRSAEGVDQINLSRRSSFVLRIVRDSADAERTVRGGETGGPALHTSTNIESPFYGWSCKLFRLPSLPPYFDEEGERSSMSRHTKEKVETRKKMRNEGTSRCRSVSAVGARLKDHVYTVNIASNRVTALLIDPFKPQLITTDGHGFLKVWDYKQSYLLNQFLVTSGQPASEVKYIHRLNELRRDMVFTCFNNAMVGVWRDCASKGQQKLVTTWQSIPKVNQSVQDASFFCTENHGLLFASDSRSQQGLDISVWSLDREERILQIRGGDGCGAKFLEVMERSPVLFAANTNGHLSVHDLRSKRKIFNLFAGNEALAGLAVEPGGVDNQLVLAYKSGAINFFDCRMFDSQKSTCSLWRSINGHSKGAVTTLCKHENAPLLATATSSQVVKVWSVRAEQIGVVRPQSSILGQNIGPTTCLAFAPYSLQLASGGDDSVCAIYSLELSK